MGQYQTQSPQQNQPPQRSWWGRHWKWVVPVGCLMPIMCCCGPIALSVSMLFGMIKGSMPYTDSLAAAKANVDVQNALGTPIEPDFIVGGNISLNGSSGAANIFYNITGPSGTATVRVNGTKSGGVWSYLYMDATINGTTTKIDLQTE
jgi:hypothetical protein